MVVVKSKWCPMYCDRFKADDWTSKFWYLHAMSSTALSFADPAISSETGAAGPGKSDT